MKYRHGEKGENAENEKNLLIPVQVEFKEDVGIYSGRVLAIIYMYYVEYHRFLSTGTSVI